MKKDSSQATPSTTRPDAASARSRRQFLRDATVVGLGVAAAAQIAPEAVAGAALRANSSPASPAESRRASVSLLDEVGRLARVVRTDEAAAWKNEIKTKQIAPERAALLHVWLGEYLLASEQEPKQAAWHFRMVQKLTRTGDPLHGLAAYNLAITQFRRGQYEECAEAFARLLRPRPVRWGFDKRRCALWHRHALACAGYHARPGALGVPRPKELDPLCGAGGLAVCLRAHGLPYDEKSVLAVCRVPRDGYGQQFWGHCRRLRPIGRADGAPGHGRRSGAKGAAHAARGVCRARPFCGGRSRG